MRLNKIIVWAKHYFQKGVIMKKYTIASWKFLSRLKEGQGTKGYTKKNAWKVTSGYLIDENADPKHDNYTTCSGGGGLVRILEF